MMGLTSLMGGRGTPVLWKSGNTLGSRPDKHTRQCARPLEFANHQAETTIGSPLGKPT